MVAAGQDGAAGPRAAGEQVDPGDRVAVAVVVGGQPGHQVVEVGGPFGVDAHQRGLHGQQLDRRGEHDAGQPHAAGRRPEQLRLVLGGDEAGAAVRRQQLDGAYVAGERPRQMVVLAVDVRADGPADRDVPGPGADGDEPAERQQDLHQPVQAHPGVADHQAVDGVDLVDPVQARHVEDGAAGVLRGVAVGPAEPAGDGAAAPAVPDRLGGLLVGARAEHMRGGGRGAAPAGDGGGQGGGSRHTGDVIAREVLIARICRVSH